MGNVIIDVDEVTVLVEIMTKGEQRLREAAAHIYRLVDQLRVTLPSTSESYRELIALIGQMDAETSAFTAPFGAIPRCRFIADEASEQLRLLRASQTESTRGRLRQFLFNLLEPHSRLPLAWFGVVAMAPTVKSIFGSASVPPHATAQGVGVTQTNRLSSLEKYVKRISDLRPGEMEVIKVGPASSKRYVVLVRGIDMHSSSTPNNGFNAVHSLLKRHDAHSRGVIDAMEKARVPLGSRVMVIGHSQGGITAMNLAGDPFINGPNGKYQLTHVVTLGSPIDYKKAAPGANTQELHIENRGDLVPDLERRVREPPSSESRARYHFGSAIPRSDGHGLERGYLPELTAERFRSAPQVRDFMDGTSRYFRGDPAQVYRYQITYRRADQ